MLGDGGGGTGVYFDGTMPVAAAIDPTQTIFDYTRQFCTIAGYEALVDATKNVNNNNDHCIAAGVRLLATYFQPSYFSVLRPLNGDLNEYKAACACYAVEENVSATKIGSVPNADDLTAGETLIG